MNILIIILLMTSCAGIQNLNKEKEEKKFNYEVKSIEVFNGKVKYVQLDLPRKAKEHKLICQEVDKKDAKKRKILFSKVQNVGHIYYAESYHSNAKEHACYYKGNKVLKVTVKQYPYQEEYLKVARGKVVLSEENKKRVEKEWLMSQELYKNTLPYSLIQEPFKNPLDSYITSRYGKRRIFNNLKKTQHLGNDFRAAVGVPIPVSNRGKVVFTGHLFYTGKVVIVDHGVGLFTFYAHLSKPLVKTGEIIDKGTTVGLSGRTGRVSGPHLHWGVKLHGLNIDGFSLVEESKKQFIRHDKLL